MAHLWFCSKVALCVLLGILCLTPAESQCSGSGSWTSIRPSHDMTSGSQLNNLYNQQVVEVERVRRPLSSFSESYGPISHSGVRVTLDDGSKYLIHKGDGFGLSSQTVVVDAKHMSSNWQVEQAKPVTGTSVGDLVKTGGSEYNVLTDNCHMAADRIME